MVYRQSGEEVAEEAAEVVVEAAEPERLSWPPMHTTLIR